MRKLVVGGMKSRRWKSTLQVKRVFLFKTGRKERAEPAGILKFSLVFLPDAKPYDPKIEHEVGPEVRFVWNCFTKNLSERPRLSSLCGAVSSPNEYCLAGRLERVALYGLGVQAR